MRLIQKLEPLFWMLFGAGGFIAAFFLPGLLIGVGLFGGLGLFETGLAFERAHGLASSPLGKVLLIAVLSLTLWHCAHHLRHLGIDLGLPAAPVAYLSYGLAVVGTLTTFSIVTGL